MRRKGGKLQALALPAPAAERIEAYLPGRDDVTALPAISGAAAEARRRVLFATARRSFTVDGLGQSTAARRSYWR